MAQIHDTDCCCALEQDTSPNMLVNVVVEKDDGSAQVRLTTSKHGLE